MSNVNSDAVHDIFLKVSVEKHPDWLQWSLNKGPVSLPGSVDPFKGWTHLLGIEIGWLLSHKTSLKS